jgi:hypothetical protein
MNFAMMRCASASGTTANKLNPPIRIAAIKSAFDQRRAEDITPLEITAWLKSLDVEPGTEARYKSTLSLCYREGMKNQKVTINPARLVSNRKVGIRCFALPSKARRGSTTRGYRAPLPSPYA